MATKAEAVQVLKVELANDITYAILNSKQVQRSLVVRPLIDNPEPAPKMLRGLDSKDLATLQVSGVGDELLARLTEILTGDDAAAMVDWAYVAQVGGLLTEQQVVKIVIYAETEVDDPSWPAQVAGPTRLEELGIAHIVWPDGAETYNGFNAGPADAPYNLIAEARL